MKHEDIHQHGIDHGGCHVHPDRGVIVSDTSLNAPIPEPGEMLWAEFNKAAEMVARNPNILDEWQQNEICERCREILKILNNEH